MADLVATVTAAAYVPPETTPAATPLDPERVIRSAADHVRVVFDVETVVGHELFFDPAAIPNRMDAYAVTDAEAIECLVRELIFSWSELEPADPTDLVQVWGGTDPRIDVIVGAEVGAEIRAVLRELGDRIVPPPPSPPPLGL